jgi:hypothetical protein
MVIPSSSQFCWRTLTSWCSILWITTFCLLRTTQCTAASIRIHNNNYATSFASVRTRSIRRHKSSSSSLLSYQIEPPIEDQQRISTSSASADDGSDNDTADFVDTDIDPEVIFSDEQQQQQQLTENNNTTESVEDNNWISATRTLGSLILHLKDETRDSNVDVFGRPLLSSNNNNNNLIDQFGLPRENQSTPASAESSDSEEEGGGSSNTSVTGFTTQFPNSLASYLLKLKRDEEDNRERIIFEEENRSRRVMMTKRDGSSSGGGNIDVEGNDKLPINLQLDQVSSLLSFPDPNL